MNNTTIVLPEIWGGIECTINRVENNYLDQLDMAGFYNNPAYLDAVIDLGIKQMRFPVLWEKHQPSPSAKINWTFSSECLNKLRLHGIIPIVGLLHHGSGPSFTNLLKDDFPELFADYAGKVAAKFPWVEYYTPVNEPLTTARFSGLYGLWYPHKKNDVSFIRILLNELKASVLAMQQIRKINPAAKFIQTEDLGKTYSTPLLSYQAEFENHRRWLTYDLLCGKFNRRHPLWGHILRLGVEMDKLQFFIDNPCPPDIIGVNHYLTSERYLDENIEHYPADNIGGNSLHHYADVEAIRIPLEEPHGPELLLKETWRRYHIPIAITEVHLNCTREDQLRWFNQVYDTVLKLQKEGVQIHAITAWAMLGSFGWNKLLTCDNCEYETGAFDISAGYPRPTALSQLISNLAGEKKIANDLIAQLGWWKLNSRYFRNSRVTVDPQPTTTASPLIIIGSTGTLGQAFSRICAERNIHHLLLGREEADICDEKLLSTMIKRHHPWAIINTAGFVNVDGAEENKDKCYRENFTGAKVLGKVCMRYGVRLMSFSTDLVFDGRKNMPYIETDIAKPLNVYGHSKYLAEKALHDIYPDTIIIRSAAFFSPWDKFNFVHQLLTTLEKGNEFTAADDIVVSPTYVPHLVHAGLDLLIDNATGIWHLVNKGCLSWYAFAKKIVEHTHLNPELINPGYDINTIAQRPQTSALESTKYRLMPSLNDAVKEYFLSDPVAGQHLTIQNLTDERI